MNYLIYLLLFLTVSCNQTKLDLRAGSSNSPTPPTPPTVDQAPVAQNLTPSNANITREKQITLSYTDAENDEATTCDISDLDNLTISSPCVCAQGTCRVSIISNALGAASFNYTVTAYGLTSDPASVTLTIVPRASFVSVWRVGTVGYGDEALTLELPLNMGYSYNMTVDWGDNTPVSTITSYGDLDKTHTYATPGDYTITMTGLAQSFRTRFHNEANKLIQVVDLGDMGWTDLSDAFSYANNLVSFAGGYTADVTRMDGMFAWTPSLTSLDVSNFNTSNVTNMDTMFYGVSKVTALNLSHFNT